MCVTKAHVVLPPAEWDYASTRGIETWQHKHGWAVAGQRLSDRC